MDIQGNSMTKSFSEKLIEILKTDSRFVDDEGVLVKAAVIDRAWKIDRDLVKLLLSEPEIEKKFFDEIEGHWIFNINTFIEYISDKNSLLNWYVNPEMPENAITDFIEMGKSENGLEKREKLLAELLNKNQLYIILSEIDDEDFAVSKEDRKSKQLFYGESYNG
jgi:hypothetical protein